MSSSSRGTISPKHGGSRAASAVLELVPELVHVPDTAAKHYDAEVEELLCPQTDLPFVGICVLEVGTIVEIKSTIVVYGENQSRGRFYLREGQHEKLLVEGGSYLFAVCEPTPQRDVISMKVVPASLVDELVSSWISVEGRATYAQIRWSRLFGPEEVRP